MKIKITNNIGEIILNFTDLSDLNSMKLAIKNCIDDSKNYPSINYSDRLDDIIFSADYLKNSLITIPKLLKKNENTTP
jgi:hypothetical protein